VHGHQRKGMSVIVRQKGEIEQKDKILLPSRPILSGRHVRAHQIKGCLYIRAPAWCTMLKILLAGASTGLSS
jgi:hypothetical protein